MQEENLKGISMEKQISKIITNNIFENLIDIFASKGYRYIVKLNNRRYYLTTIKPSHTKDETGLDQKDYLTKPITALKELGLIIDFKQSVFDIYEYLGIAEFFDLNKGYKVLVSHDGFNWKKAYYSHYDDFMDRYYVFINGKTEWSSNGKTEFFEFIKVEK